MAFASFDSNRSSAPMAEINMVPLIDVMLVLLVIFIVTAPLLTHSVVLDLPKASTTPRTVKPETIELSIDADGNRFWGKDMITREDAAARFAEASLKDPQPQVHLRADQQVPYRYVAETLADASKAGLSKIGFVSNPQEPQAAGQ